MNLALQGGGAHGAFTWGVLDRLLEDGRLIPGWISGTSAGALNAATLAVGLANTDHPGDTEPARLALGTLWNGIAEAAVPDLVRFNPWLAAPLASFQAMALSNLPGVVLGSDAGSGGADLLRRLIAAHVDTARLQAVTGPELLIAATDVATGRARLFRRHEITVDVLLASACLPALHPAVIIDGRAYWDGGYSANPDLLTLAGESPVEDTLIVQIAPLVRDVVPRTGAEIVAHVNHMTFNAPYLRDLDTVAALRRIHGALQPRGIARLWRATPPATRETRIARHRFHLIDAGRATATLPTATKIKPERELLDYLFKAGRSEASLWLERHAADVGRADTADLDGRQEARAVVAAR